MEATVKYQIATYEGEVIIPCEPDEEDEVIIAKAKSKLRKDSGPLPFGYQSWKVVERN
jgi:hypothetical protein